MTVVAAYEWLAEGNNLRFILEGFLDVDTFKTPEREKLWRYTWHARRFVERNLPFWEMEPNDALVSGAATVTVRQVRERSHQLGAQVFAKPGEVYAIWSWGCCFGKRSTRSMNPSARASGRRFVSGFRNVAKNSSFSRSRTSF